MCIVEWWKISQWFTFDMCAFIREENTGVIGH